MKNSALWFAAVGILPLACAGVAVAAHMPSRSPHRAAKGSTPPVGNPAAVFGTDAYPPEALAAGAHGRVVVRLDVDAAGRVQNCALTTSSGSPLLDATTCRLAKTVVYHPARDGRGRAIPATLPLGVVWEAPDDLMSQVWTIDTSYGSDGSLKTCRETLGRQALANSATCEMIAARGEPLPTEVAPLGGRVVRRRTWIGHDDPPPPTPADAFAGFTVVRIETTSVHVGPTGEATGCERQVQGGIGAPKQGGVCATPPGAHYPAIGRPYDQVSVVTWGVDRT